MAITAVVGIVTAFLTAVYQTVSGGKIRHETDGIFVAGIWNFTPLQNADGGHAQIVYLRVQAQALVRFFLQLVVVDMGIARVPVLRRQIHPALQQKFCLHRAPGGYGHDLVQGFVLGTALNQDIGGTPRQIEAKFAAAVKKWDSRSHLHNTVGRMHGTSGAVQNMHLGSDRGARNGIAYYTFQSSHY